MRRPARAALVAAAAVLAVWATPGLGGRVVGRARAGSSRLLRVPRRRDAVRVVCTATQPAAEAAVTVDADLDEEAKFMEKTKVEEEAEKQRLVELKDANMTAFTWELRNYVDQINATGPPPLAPDNELRDVILRSSSANSRLLDDIYNYTFRNVPYDDAMYICAPEQATLLQLLARVMRAREALDVGSFTGYSAAAVAHALPASGRMTLIEAKREYAEIAARFLGTLPPALDVRVGDAREQLHELERDGRQFDFISIDADKQQQKDYYEACLRLLRPRGMLVMFGMMLYPTEEDKEAIDDLITLVANDTRVTTTMLPIGCGVQVCTKRGDRCVEPPLPPPADCSPEEQRRYLLQAELAAIDTALADAERNAAAKGEYMPVPPPAPEDGDSGGSLPAPADPPQANDGDGGVGASAVLEPTPPPPAPQQASSPMAGVKVAPRSSPLPPPPTPTPATPANDEVKVTIIPPPTGP